MDYAGKLERLGWTRKQAEVYLALLAIGPATAYQVAKKCGLKRPTVYVLLDELRKMEAVLVAPDLRKQVYAAKPPEELVNRAAEQLNDLIGSLPAIKALAKRPERPIVHYFQGKKEVVEALDYDIAHARDAEIVGFYAADQGIDSSLKKAIDAHNERLRVNRVKVRGVVPDSPTIENYRASDSRYGREMKIIPTGLYDAGSSFDIGPDFIRLIAYRDQLAVVIESERIAKSLKQVFDLLWQRL